MKNTTITEIEQAMLPFLDNAQMNQLHEVLTHSLWGKEIVVCENQESVSPKDDELLEMFVSSKRVEGCSEKTLRYYRTTINKMFSSVTTGVTHITTDDLHGPIIPPIVSPIPPVLLKSARLIGN